MLGIVARMDEETPSVKSHAPSSRKVRDKQLALNLFKKKKNHRQRRQLIAHQQPKSPIPNNIVIFERMLSLRLLIQIYIH